MPTIDQTPLAFVTEAQLDELVTAGASEVSGRYDFKLELNLANDDQKKEFCTDVASFANASGGLLLYGVDEVDAIASAVKGITIDSVDELIQRIGNLLSSNIAPRLPRYEVSAIPLKSERYVVALRVQRSQMAPHAVVKPGNFRFFTRSAAGKRPMDMPEVRHSILLSESLRERLRSYRAERVGRIIANDGIVPLHEGAKLILQIVPLESLGNQRHYDLTPHQDWQNHDLCTIGSRYPMGKRINLDGVVDVMSHDEKQGRAIGYVQLHENGIIEAADADQLKSSENVARYRNSVGSRGLIQLFQAYKKYEKILRDLQVDLPFYIFVSMTGLKGRKFFFDDYNSAPNLCDRDDLVFPEIAVSDYNTPADRLLQPIFDSFFRAFGMPKCPWYDPEGNLRFPTR